MKRYRPIIFIGVAAAIIGGAFLLSANTPSAKDRVRDERAWKAAFAGVQAAGEIADNLEEKMRALPPGGQLEAAKIRFLEAQEKYKALVKKLEDLK